MIKPLLRNFLSASFLLMSVLVRLNAQDTIPPNIQCPESFTGYANLPGCVAVFGLQWPEFSDNSGGNIKIDHTLSGATSYIGPGFVWDIPLNMGLNTIAYTATDESGNSASCSFQVEILCPQDSEMCTKSLAQIQLQPSSGFTQLYNYDMQLDSQGNVVQCGLFNGTVDFDPGPGQYLLQAGTSGYNGYVFKIDPDGKLLWASQVGAPQGGVTHFTSMATDLQGNLYFIGGFTGGIDADPGPGEHWLTASSTNTDVFYLKLSPQGEFLWAGQVGGNSYDVPNAIATDRYGNIYTIGSFHGFADIDPGPGNWYAGDPTSSQSFSCISKLSSSGTLLWAQTFSFPAWDLTLDTNGNIYLLGKINFAQDLAPGDSTYYLDPAGAATTVTKMDSSGAFQWAIQVNGADDIYSYITIDPAQNILVAGHFTGELYCESLHFSQQNAWPGTPDAYVAKFAPSGQLIWAKQFGRYADEFIYDIKSDTAGNIYITGKFLETTDLDPDPDQSYIVGALTGYPNFVNKLDSDGNFIWGKVIGSNGEVLHLGIHTNGCVQLGGNIFAIGDFNPTLDTFFVDPANGNVISYKMCPCDQSVGIPPVDAVALVPTLRCMPNPFGDFSTLTYKLPSAAQVRMELLDGIGRLYAVIDNQFRPAGVYTLDFQSSQWLPGIYYCRFSVGDHVRMLKLVKL